MDQIFYNTLDGILPVMFIFSDSILYYTGFRTTNTILIITYFKLIVTLCVLGYLAYLYFYKKEVSRESNNVVDLGINGIIVFILFIVITIMTKKLHEEQQEIKIREKPIQEESKV